METKETIDTGIIVDTESGVLTKEMLESFFRHLNDNFGEREEIIMPLPTYNAIIEHEKWLGWLRTLSHLKRKEEVLKDRIKRRRDVKYKNYNERIYINNEWY